MNERKRGLSKLDLIAVLGILTLVVVFVIPRLGGLRMAHNEEDAVFALKVLRERMIELKDSRHGPGIHSKLTPEQLLQHAPGERPPLDDCRFEIGLGDEPLMCRHGYVFRIDYESDERIDSRSGYVIYAWPEKYDETGAAVFASPADGRLLRARNLMQRYSGFSNSPRPMAHSYHDLSAAGQAEEEGEGKPRHGLPESRDGMVWEAIPWN